MDKKVQNIEKAWENAVTTHKSLGKAMTAVVQLETACKEYLSAKIEALDIPREYRDRIIPVLDKYHYRLDPEITPTSPDVMELRRYMPSKSKNFPPGYYVFDPLIMYAVNIKNRPNMIVAELNALVDSLIKAVLPAYLKPSKSMRQLLVKLLENLNYEIPEEGSNQTNVAADDLKRMLLNYFDIRIIDNVADYDRNSDDLYFEFEKNPHIQSPFITQPAVISEVNGKKEVLIKGTMLLPSKSIG